MINVKHFLKSSQDFRYGKLYGALKLMRECSRALSNQVFMKIVFDIRYPWEAGKLVDNSKLVNKN